MLHVYTTTVYTAPSSIVLSVVSFSTSHSSSAQYLYPCRRSGRRPPLKWPSPAVEKYAIARLQSCLCPPSPTVAAAVARRRSHRCSSGLCLPLPAFATAVARRHSCRSSSPLPSFSPSPLPLPPLPSSSPCYLSKGLSTSMVGNGCPLMP